MSLVENICEKNFNIVSKGYMCCYFKNDTLNITSASPVSILYNPIYDYNPSNSFKVSINNDHPFYEFLEKLCDENLHKTYFTKRTSMDKIVLDIDYNQSLREKFLKGYNEEGKSFVKMGLKVRKGYNKEFNFWFFKMDVNKFDFIE